MKFCLHFKRHISKIHNIIEKFEKSLKIRETLFTFQLHNAKQPVILTIFF